MFNFLCQSFKLFVIGSEFAIVRESFFPWMEAIGGGQLYAGLYDLLDEAEAHLVEICAGL